MKDKHGATPDHWWLVVIVLTFLPIFVQAQSNPVIVQAMYDCTTGVIDFRTAGGNGSPITFSAPGVSLSSPASTTGMVELALRSAPRPITISAIQSGLTTNYVFDLADACTHAKPPVLVRPIPDLTVAVGQTLTRYGDAAITISHYFSDPNRLSAHYKSLITFVGSGLPEGMYLTDYSTDDLPRAYIEGTPKVPGIYTVTIIAALPLLYTLGDTRTTTTFRITVSG